MFGALKPGFRSLATLKLVMNVVGELTLNRKEQPRHCAVSLRQHGFLVSFSSHEPLGVRRTERHTHGRTERQADKTRNAA